VCDVSAVRSAGRVAPVRGWWVTAATHLFEQREDVDGEEAQGGGDHEAGLLLQVGHVALVGAHQVHRRVGQGVASVRQAGRDGAVDGCEARGTENTQRGVRGHGGTSR